MPSLFALFGLLGALYVVGGKRDKDSDDTEQRTDIMSDVSDEAETTPDVPVVAVENDVAEESQDVETIDNDIDEEPVVVVSEDHTAEIPEEIEAHEDVETVDHDEHNEHDHDEHEQHDGVDHVEGGEHDADAVHDEGVDHDEHEHHEGGDHVDGGEHDDDAVHDEDADHDMSHDEHAHTPEGFIDITEFGEYHHASMHTGEAELEGGRTAITTEAHVAYNALRDFLDLDPVELETVGEWAFENDLTNNDEAYGDDLEAVGLFYSMQGTKVGWIDDESFDPQILADIQRTARLGEPEDVMDMVAIYGHDGFADYLEEEGLTEAFINTLKMEPHYGGIMHGRTHGRLEFEAEPDAEYETPTAHDLNHLTVLSHDQTQPFMNDTFDYPQWPALDASEEDVLNYFQSMVTLGDPHGEGIEIESIEADADIMSEGELLMALLATDTVLDETLPSTEEMDELHMEM